MAETSWKYDATVEAATKLPKWARFHRACGERRVFFDHIERDGRRGYRCVAFRTEPTKVGGWRALHVSDGAGKDPLEALGDALAKSGHDIPEAVALLAAGLRENAPPVADEFAALITDDFEGLLA